MVKINIILKFVSSYCSPVFIRIYDENNNLVFEDNTNDGTIEVYLKKYHSYRLVACNHYQKLITSFYVNNLIKFVFALNDNVNRSVTFLLTDYYYDNLPIMKGEILLGKNS